MYRRCTETIIQVFSTNSLQHIIVDRVRSRKLELFGHTCRMPDNRALKGILFGTVAGRSYKGRPRKRWIDDILEWYVITAGGTPYTRSREMEEFRGWPLRFLNHETRRLDVQPYAPAGMKTRAHLHERKGICSSSEKAERISML